MLGSVLRRIKSEVVVIECMTSDSRRLIGDLSHVVHI